MQHYYKQSLKILSREILQQAHFGEPAVAVVKDLAVSESNSVDKALHVLLRWIVES